jgi:hypothetical protein
VLIQTLGKADTHLKLDIGSPSSKLQVLSQDTLMEMFLCFWHVSLVVLARQIPCKDMSTRNVGLQCGKNELHMTPLFPNLQGTVSMAPIKTD